MRFFKVSIIIIFVLSLLAGGATFYLSALRENEKEKRIQAEETLHETEQKIQDLESRQADLTTQLTTSESQVQQLSSALDREKIERAKTVNLVSQKDTQVKTIQQELSGTKKSFQKAQQRNQEMEKILKGLETRLRETEMQAKEASEKLKQFETRTASDVTGTSLVSPRKEAASSIMLPSFIRQVSLTGDKETEVVGKGSIEQVVTTGNVEQVFSKRNVEQEIKNEINGQKQSVQAVIPIDLESVPQKVASEPVKEKKKFWLTRFFSKIFGFFFRSRKNEVVNRTGDEISASKPVVSTVTMISPQSNVPLMEIKEEVAPSKIEPKKIVTEPKLELKPVEDKFRVSQTLPNPDVLAKPTVVPQQVSSPTQSSTTALKGRLPSVGAVKSVPAESVVSDATTTQTVTQANPGQEGKVLLINRNFNFVVVNLGAKNSLSMDDFLFVKRNGKQIAKVRVEKIYDEYSAAYIVEEDSSFPIAESDLVSGK